ncbi:MAG: RNA polymerase sigma factor FliA [Gammaproteobacteria bacterium]|nr:RNA polymerase sigma factor FliA [Gammaproteobacteria bacterium]
MNVLAGYTETRSLGSEPMSYDEVLVQHAPLVKRIAYHLMGRLPSNIQHDDLIQAGLVGLFEAIKRYDSTLGASFETYARIRIQGAMIDEVRRGDWTPRSVYRKSRQLSDAIRKIEDREGRDAKPGEVAEYLEMDIGEYNKLVSEAAGCQMLSYEDISGVDAGHHDTSSESHRDPGQQLEQSDFKQGLAEKISSLPERERLVMALYYDEEFNLREIGEVLGVSEGRVCQIHGQALTRLRARMADWRDEEDG